MTHVIGHTAHVTGTRDVFVGKVGSVGTKVGFKSSMRQAELRLDPHQIILVFRGISPNV